ncbi:MAG: WbqC family protein [Cyclobacteriaceae bacterium]
MKKILIEPHYLGCVEYFCLMQSSDSVLFEINDNFQKQTFRNRSYILGSNKVVTLSMPLKYGNKTAFKDVKVDYSQRWIKDHWGAVYSSYGKAPFFEFFASDFKKVWDQKSEFLLDINIKFLTLCFKLLKLDVEIDFTNSYKKDHEKEAEDFRNIIHPKIAFADRNIYRPSAYSQLFGNSFAANLSIIDLIMCAGPQADEVLSSSYVGN